MAKPLLDDALWVLLEPLFLPSKPRRFRYPGRQPLDARPVLTGILFVLKTGIQWEHLPQEMGCGSGMTCWRRLRDWQKAGVWSQVHQLLLTKLRQADQLDWSRAVVDSAFVRAVGAGAKSGPNPTDRGKAGSKHHLLTEAQGIPLAALLTAANVPDIVPLLPLTDAVPSVAGQLGRPRRRPDKLQGDRAYDSQPHRYELRRRGIQPVLAKRNTEHGSGLGIYRWVVERTLSWLHQFRRLRIRYERRDDLHEAFLAIGCAMICWAFLA